MLVVEDEPLVRMLACDLLRDADHTVLEAGSALEALTVLEHHADVALVFTDVDMPGPIDGLELARVAAERWPHIPVLVTSGLHHGGASGSSHFISKPYGLAGLLSEVERLLDL